MSEERRRVLNMLAEGKVTPQEAENLLEALSGKVAAGSDLVVGDPKYLRVLVEGDDGKVNVRVPFTLLHAGMRLAALLPAAAHEPINRALKENGLEIDISKIKPENLEDLVTHLRELAVDVEGARGEKVRVYCE